MYFGNHNNVRNVKPIAIDIIQTKQDSERQDFVSCFKQESTTADRDFSDFKFHISYLRLITPKFDLSQDKSERLNMKYEVQNYKCEYRSCKPEV